MCSQQIGPANRLCKCIAHLKPERTIHLKKISHLMQKHVRTQQWTYCMDRWPPGAEWTWFYWPISPTSAGDSLSHTFLEQKAAQFKCVGARALQGCLPVHGWCAQQHWHGDTVPAWLFRATLSSCSTTSPWAHPRWQGLAMCCNL